ncbi:MAG: hypothetical protein H0T59_11660 [Chloroflexi bacterium]|nr:hypothetical protein [Chloroflexota bacterium]
MRKFTGARTIAAMFGLPLVALAIIFFVVPTAQGLTVDYNDVAAGTTMLLFLSVAMAIMAYVLVAGRSNE